MKRSDVIENLQEFLDTVVFEDSTAASAILAHMEMLGLQAPDRLYGFTAAPGWDDE